MVDSNSTHRDQGPLGEFALGEFVLGPSSTFPIIDQLSEPVRQKRDKRMAIALIASGTFQIVTTTFPERVDEAKWHYPWSEPVRIKPGLKSALQQATTGDTSPIPTSRGMGWFATLSEPVRLPKGLKTFLQRDFTIDTRWVPAATISFLSWYSEPVRQKKGLRKDLQATYTGPMRLLPTPNVTVTMSGIEVNKDVALFAINVYDTSSTTIVGQGAKVSIIEVEQDGNSPVSVRET